MSIKNNSELKAYFQKGLKPTQAQFGDLIDSLSLPYSCYTAILDQYGADAPEANVLVNNTEVDFLWQRTDVGSYTCRLPRGIDIQRMFVTVRDQNGPREDISVQITSGRIKSIDLLCPGDDLLSNTLIEVRYYNEERIVTTRTDGDLSRYFGYFAKRELINDGNLYLSPQQVYRPAVEENNEGDGSAETKAPRPDVAGPVANKKQSLELFKLLPDRYVILPEIWDGHKNPYAYNLDTHVFCNFYSIERGENFIKNAVKKSLEAGAAECVLFLGKDDTLLKDNLSSFERAVNSGNDKGIQSIKVLFENNDGTQLREYTLEDFRKTEKPVPPKK